MSAVFRTGCLALTILWLTACSKEPLYQEQGYVFGTLVEVSVYGETEANATLAVAAVMQEFQRLHTLLHAWKPSALSDLNAAFAQGKSATVSAELQLILQNATQLSIQSDGLFNPAIGSLVQRWGFHADEFKPALPDEKQLIKLLSQHPQMNDIAIKLVTNNKNAHYDVSSRNRSVQLDLGGYAKGYALDRAAALLRKMKVQNALINIGGNVMALGRHGTRDWRVGIQHPRKPGPLATLALHDGEAIGTSGDYQRYFELGGKRFCHLIDPRNGQPAQGVQAVTVLTHGEQAGVLSDATSKPLFISGANNWMQAATKMQLDNALLIDEKGTVHLTAAMQKRLEFTDQSMGRVVEK